jgi:GNAT superfamily N-acetyltransferase
MLELEADRYSTVSSLVARVPFNHLFASVVLQKRVRGRVLVDDDRSPSVCLVVHKYGMSLLCGDTGNERINTELKGFLRNDSSNHGTAKWMICYPEGWEPTLANLLGGDLTRAPDSTGEAVDGRRRPGSVLQTERVNFRFDSKPPSIRPTPPAEYTLRKVDPELYDRITGSVIPQSFWDSAEDFLRSGIGFSLLDEAKIISTCFSSFIVGNQLELGIETQPGYRGKGLSVFPAAAAIDYCLSHRYEPVWACRRENTSSFRLALKLGFSPLSYHPYYAIPRT